jgi:hypothetical protein
VSRGAIRVPLVTSLLLLVGCGSEQHLTNPPPPGVEDHVVVSEPVPFGQASSVGSIALGGTGVTAATTFSFTTFRPGAFPEGDAVEILNRRTGVRLSASMLDGGLDPIGIPAEVGDELEITVFDGPTPLFTVAWVVPVRLPPIIVRTDPPDGKTKVPLNASVMVVFSEPMDPDSLMREHIRVLRDGVPVPGEVRILDGGLRVEFVPNQELARSVEYTIALGTALRDLSGDALEAEYSATFTTDNPPLNNKIVFEDRATGIGEIHFMNPDGTGVVQVTDRSAGGWSMSPALSPDGTAIAFAVWVPDVADWEIYTINVDGSGLRNLTNHPSYDGWRPTWSPDGTRIAFFSARTGDDEIYTIGVDGSGLERLTFDPADDAHPAWSPDGARIAFVSNREAIDPLRFGIYVMGADGSQPTLLTEHTSDDDWPAWSPEGTRIAFVSDRSGSRGIWVMNADGSTPILLIDGGASTPAWSPDGTRIAFDVGGDLYIMNADGTDAQRIRNGFFPSWGP